jgi:hypothetical protein
MLPIFRSIAMSSGWRGTLTEPVLPTVGFFTTGRLEWWGRAVRASAGAVAISAAIKITINVRTLALTLNPARFSKATRRRRRLNSGLTKWKAVVQRNQHPRQIPLILRSSF